MRGGMIGLLGLILTTPGWADVVFLKSGQRIEGEVSERTGQVEIKSDLATVVVAKAEVIRIVRSVEKIEAEAKSLHDKARALFAEAGKLESDVPAANEKLKQGVELLRKAVDLYHEARETYSDEKYARLDDECVRLIQEIRVYRDRMKSELAGPVPADKKDPEPAKPEPPRPEPEAAKPVAPPPAAPAGPAKPDVEGLLAKAKSGDTEAQYALALHYETTQWSGAEALKWLKPLADKDHPRALWKLAVFNLTGRVPKHDVKEAQKLLNKAEARGLALAQIEIGKMYFYGQGGRRDFRKADEWCGRGAAKIRAEAEAGDPEAQVAYGWMQSTGMGLKSWDPSKGPEYWKKAWAAGFTPAANWIADATLWQNPKEKATRDEARKWYLLAAERGYAEAQSNLFEMNCVFDPTFNRRGRQKDAEALDPAVVDWLRKAVDQGHPRALLFMAVECIVGTGPVPKNLPEAVRLLTAAQKTATGKTLTFVQNQLGVLYRNGEGVPKDLKEAQRLFQLIADRGEPLAFGQLGMLQRDQGNQLEAVRYWKLGAAQREVGSMSNLGAVYAMGQGVKKDLEEAYRWFVMAAQEGYQPAIQNLEQCKRDLAAERAKGGKK